ncbi:MULTISPECIES: response regulator transcription factor [unclassified Sphingomonas]|uniref:response regulator transcription factor n=1 Tax=unclassified Sphingomonas TaxID=196159 RepID=UPI001D10EA54|nr:MULTISPECIES: response regulator [unclassified Sphingomonas]MCC2979790.1 response regulator [Sphingomonas sp. IC4-52]MCD2314551.1 response regulator [Sphingomonas sp. IC-11]
MESKLVHLVDDEEEVRAATAFMLEADGYAVRSWRSATAFVDALARIDPGCVLLDIRMPDISGLEVQQQLKQASVNLPVIVLTGHGDITVAVKAMRAGALTFLEKPPEREALMDALTEGFDRLADASTAAAREEQARRLIARLSERERDVLGGLTRGLPNKYIAYDLDISPRTVEIHRANLMSKLGVRSLSEALRIAFSADFGRTNEGRPQQGNPR